MPPEPEGKTPPPSFQYSVTYPTSPYSPGQSAPLGQGVAPGPEEPPSAGEGAGRVRGKPAIRPAALAAIGLLVVLLVVLGVKAWPTRSAPDMTLRPTQPSPAAQGPTVDPAVTEAVEAWLRGGGQLVIDNLAADYHKVAAVTAANDVPGLVPVCGALRTSAETAQAYPPIPDAEAQVHWAASLAQSARAGTDCLAGVTANYLELVTQAGHEAGASSRESALMIARLQVVRGN